MVRWSHPLLSEILDALKSPRASKDSTSNCNAHPRQTSHQQFARTDAEAPGRPKAMKKFRYKPLDHSQPSIRLVRFLPELSEAGFIQCEISHATTHAYYACLSYVWDYPRRCTPSQGKSTHLRSITINGLFSQVRENLFNFLCTARLHPIGARGTLDPAALWIDALCIDQSNPLERNHQVRQMGEIYSHAHCVHAWLGQAPLSTLVKIGMEHGRDRSQQFEELLESTVATMQENNGFVETIEPSSNQTLDISESLFQLLLYNPYWERAWVVQEMILAKELVFWLHGMQMDPKLLRKVASKLLTSPPIDWLVMSPDRANFHYLDYHCGIPKGKQRLGIKHIVTLLDQFPNKKCSDNRDRVFSLLSLIESEDTLTEVDYNVPLEQLAYQVLYYSPGPICVCSAVVVSRSLNLQRRRRYRSWKHALDGPWIEFDVETSRFSPWAVNPESRNHGLSDTCGALVAEYYHFSVTEANDSFQIQRKVSKGGFYSTMTSVRIALVGLGDLIPHPVRLCGKARSLTGNKLSHVRLGWGRNHQRHQIILDKVRRRSVSRAVIGDSAGPLDDNGRGRVPGTI